MAILPSGYLWQCLEIILVVTVGEERYWLLVGSGQGCYYTSYDAQDKPPHPVPLLALSTTKNCPTLNVSSAESEKSRQKAKALKSERPGFALWFCTHWLADLGQFVRPLRALISSPLKWGQW